MSPMGHMSIQSCRWLLPLVCKEALTSLLCMYDVSGALSCCHINCSRSFQTCILILRQISWRKCSVVRAFQPLTSCQLKGWNCQLETTKTRPSFSHVTHKVAYGNTDLALPLGKWGWMVAHRFTHSNNHWGFRSSVIKITMNICRVLVSPQKFINPSLPVPQHHPSPCLCIVYDYQVY